MAREKAKVRGPNVLVLGYDDPDDEAIPLAKKFPHVRIRAVDSEGKGVGRGDLPKNLELVKGDMKTQLSIESPESLDMVSSKMVYGYYVDGAREHSFRYSQQVSDLAFSRLKPGKKFYIVAGVGLVDKISGCLDKSGFDLKVTQPPGPGETSMGLKRETKWMKALRESDAKLRLIIATKPKP